MVLSSRPAPQKGHHSHTCSDVLSFTPILTLGKGIECVFDIHVCTQVERIIQSHPKVLGYRVNGKLQDLGTFLLSELMMPREKAASVIAKVRYNLSCSIIHACWLPQTSLWVDLWP